MQLDARVSAESIRQFAGEVPHIHPAVRHGLMEHFVGAESPEFYAGYLSALGAMFQLDETPKFHDLPGSMIAIVSEQTLRTMEAPPNA